MRPWRKQALLSGREGPQSLLEALIQALRQESRTTRRLGERSPKQKKAGKSTHASRT